MDRQRTRQLAARFIAEAEADINYGLAEGLDPHHEYASLVARLHAAVNRQTQGSAGQPGVTSGAGCVEADGYLRGINACATLREGTGA